MSLGLYDSTGHDTRYNVVCQILFDRATTERRTESRSIVTAIYVKSGSPHGSFSLSSSRSPESSADRSRLITNDDCTHIYVQPDRWEIVRFPWIARYYWRNSIDIDFELLKLWEILSLMNLRYWSQEQERSDLIASRAENSVKNMWFREIQNKISKFLLSIFSLSAHLL